MSRGTLDPAMLLSISDTRLSRFFAGLPRPFSYQSQINYAVLTPQNKFRGLGSFPFARRYLGNRCFFLFLRVLRCFSSGFPPMRYGLAHGYLRSAQVGFPIRTSAAQWIFAPPRGFSQLITSFFGSQCLGIRPVLFTA